MRRSVLGAGLSRFQLEALVDNSEDAIATLDREGTVLAWNQGAADLCGYTAEEAVGRQLAALVVPAELMHQRNELLGAVAAGKTVERRLLRRSKDGRRRMLAVRMAPVREDGGEVVGSVWIARDVNDRRELERSERSNATERRWRRRIAEALASDGLVFAAQPMVEIGSGEVVRFELLMRMRSASRLIAPGDFLPHAERSGQIRELDRWAVRNGVALAQAYPVAINISGASIADPTLVAEVRECLRRGGVDPGRVTFEITETSAAEDLGRAGRLIEELCRMGCGVSLDDFGTGFGSLTYLHRLPVTELKIDREFIGPDRRSLDRRVVETVLAAARIFGMKTVAEGVEDEAMLRCLEELGVDFAQGWLLGRPTVVAGPDDLRELAEGREPRPRALPESPGPTVAWPAGSAAAAGDVDGPGQIREMVRTQCEEARRLRARAQAAKTEAGQLRADRPSRQPGAPERGVYPTGPSQDQRGMARPAGTSAAEPW